MFSNFQSVFKLSNNIIENINLQAGNRTLFAEAIAIAKRKENTFKTGIPDFTFITGMDAESKREAELQTDRIVDKVMASVANELGLGTSAETLLLRDRARLPPT